MLVPYAFRAYDLRMTTMRLVPNTGEELPSQQIARRIREVMAGHRITGVKLAEAIGMDQTAFSRRNSGKIDWSFDEVARVAEAFGMSFNDLCAIRDSNPEPADSASDLQLTIVPGALADNVFMLDLRRSQTSELDLVEVSRPALTVVRDGAA